LKNKLLVLAITAVVIGGAAWAGSTRALAATTGKYPPVVQKLIDKFGLKETEVQTVIEEARTEQQTTMQTRMEERLTDAVGNGKITEAQKTAILAKWKEISAKRETERQELSDWAKQNGLESDYGFGWFGGHGRGMHGGWGMGMM